MKSVDVKDLGKIAVVMGGSSGEREVSLMSGSGPTVFGLFTNQTAAQAAYEELRYGSSQDLAKQVYLTSFYNRKGHADGEQF